MISCKLFMLALYEDFIANPFKGLLLYFWLVFNFSEAEVGIVASQAVCRAVIGQSYSFLLGLSYLWCKMGAVTLSQ